MRIKAIGRKLKEELQNTRGPFINTSKSFYMQKEVVQGKWEGKAFMHYLTYSWKASYQDKLNFKELAMFHKVEKMKWNQAMLH